MSPLIAGIAYALGIIGMFALQREPASPPSKALWLPVIWLSISGSRMVSQWLNMSSLDSTADQLLEGSPVDRVVLTGLLIMGILVLLLRRNQVAILLQVNVALVLFFLYCSISIMWSDYPAIAFKHWIKFGSDFVMVMIVVTDVNPKKALKYLLSSVGFVLVPTSVLLIKYYPEMGRAYDPWTGRAVYMGVAADKNMLGMLCLVLGIGCVWQVADAWQAGEGALKTKMLIAQSALLFMVIWLLHLSDSMTSLSCFIVGSAIILLLSFSRVAGRPSSAHVIVIAAVVMSLSTLFLNLGDGFVQTMGRDSTLTGRTELWQRLLTMSDNSIFGSGFGSFWLGKRLEQLWAIYWWHPSESHNGYLEIFLNLGWVGIMLLSGIMVAGYKNVFRSICQGESVGKLRLAYFVVAVMYNLTEAAFKMMNPIWIMFLLAIIAVPPVSVSEGAYASMTDQLEQYSESSLLVG